MKEDVVRCLSVSWAKQPGVARALIEEFKKASDPSLKWAIGNALEVLADDEFFDELVEILGDRSHGRAREMLARSLGKSKNPRAGEALVRLLADPDVSGQAVAGLRKLVYPPARSALLPFSNHEKTWIRNEAKKAIEKIDKTLARIS